MTVVIKSSGIWIILCPILFCQCSAQKKEAQHRYKNTLIAFECAGDVIHYNNVRYTGNIVYNIDHGISFVSDNMQVSMGFFQDSIAESSVKWKDGMKISKPEYNNIISEKMTNITFNGWIFSSETCSFPNGMHKALFADKIIINFIKGVK